MTKIEDINEDIRLGMLDFGRFSEINPNITKREMERKGVNFLMSEMLKPKAFSIIYNEANKPFLEGETEQISISHSHDRLAIAINKNNDIGVDIELIRDKVINVKHKFLSDTELSYAGSEIEMLTLLWAAKEAIYKAYGKKGIEFKNIMIDPFTIHLKGELAGTLKLNNGLVKYKLMYRRLDNYILALVIHADKL